MTELRTVFKPEESPFGPLEKQKAITEPEIAEELQQTFFERRHLREQFFGQEHVATVSLTANNLGTDEDNVHHHDEEFTMPELEKEIKNLPRSTVFDT